jgi:drug/metabolite transporter (DMT)-like permease
MVHMKHHDRNAIFALAAAGALWGLSVPLSKLALGWLPPAWLTVVRFAAAAPVLAVVGRRGLREALTLRIALSGAVGFGAVILLQNAGIERTSVAHAALLVGAVPVLVALIAAGTGHGAAQPLGWGGYVLTLGGIALVARAGGGGAHPDGDLLVVGSVVLSATFIALQPRLLAGRDPAAVTAVQFGAGALTALPVALLGEGVPPAPAHPGALLALTALALAGTPLPFWLFAFGQARVPAHLAGAFVNLEPLVGAVIGWIAFGDAAGTTQLAGAAAVLAGIGLSAAGAGPEAAGEPRHVADDQPPGHVSVGGRSHAAAQSCSRTPASCSSSSSCAPRPSAKAARATPRRPMGRIVRRALSSSSVANPT